MAEQQQYFFPSESGRSAAFVVYVLYLMSIPSAGVLALVGLIVAYMARPTASGAALLHLDEQIRTWWAAFWWNVLFGIVVAVGAILTIVLIGIPIVWIGLLGWFVVMVWFTVRAVLGLIALLEARAR